MSPVSAQRYLHLFSGPHDRSDGFRSFLRREHDLECQDVDSVNADAHTAETSDLLRDDLWERLRASLDAGELLGILAGPPCSTFSRARNRRDGGPRPLRSKAEPYGLGKASLEPHEVDALRKANYMALRTVSLCLRAGDHGGPLLY